MPFFIYLEHSLYLSKEEDNVLKNTVVQGITGVKKQITILSIVPIFIDCMKFKII